jgi:predicted transcriptional regulator
VTLIPAKDCNDNSDWFDNLNIEQQQSIIRGLEQADRGEKIPHNEAIAQHGL